MTAENCLKLLEAYKEKMENGETSAIKEQSKKNYEMMINHIKMWRPEIELKKAKK